MIGWAWHFDFNNAGYWLEENHDVFMLKPYRDAPERLFWAFDEIGLALAVCSLN